MKKTILALLIASALLFSACQASPSQALEAALGTLQVVAVADGANLGLSPTEIKQVVTVTNGVENIIQAQKLGWATQANLAFATLEAPGLFSGTLDTYIEGVQGAFNAAYAAGIL
jgi:hypothetical protein